MKLYVSGIGIWSDLAQDWEQLKTALAENSDTDPAGIPRSELIPRAERRRAPKTAKLAVEVAEQACRMAKADISETASVFTSVLADTEISDNICRALALPQKILSPTKFHNSVQNAPAGYWAIGSGNHSPCNYVGGFMESWALALIEAASQCLIEQRDVLLVNYDIANKAPLSDVCQIDESFASALLLQATCTHKDSVELELELCAGSHPQPVAQSISARTLSRRNPSAAVLAQLEVFAMKTDALNATELRWPINSDAHLRIRSWGSL